MSTPPQFIGLEAQLNAEIDQYLRETLEREWKFSSAYQKARFMLEHKVQAIGDLKGVELKDALIHLRSYPESAPTISDELLLVIGRLVVQTYDDLYSTTDLGNKSYFLGCKVEHYIREARAGKVPEIK